MMILELDNYSAFGTSGSGNLIQIESSCRKLKMRPFYKIRS